MSGRIRTSLQGIELIKSFEGFRSSASRLPDGKWIIGHGHVRSAREGVTITPKDAEDLLRYDLRFVEESLSHLVFAPLNQNQFDALASLVFNISPNQFKDSDVLRRINAGDYLNAASGFDGWRRARINGRVIIVDALVRRRAAEKALFLENPDGRPSAPTPLVRPEFDPGMMDVVVEASSPAPQRPQQVSPAIDTISASRRETEEAITRGLEKLQQQTPPRAANDPTTAPQIPVGGDRATVAARLARILDRSEKAVAVKASPEVVEDAPPARPRVELRSVPEDLPDFDAPAEPPKSVAQPQAKTVVESSVAKAGAGSPPRPRIYIDDTEVYEPGRDPDDLFAEAEAKDREVSERFAQKPAAAKAESGDQRSWALSLAPWAAMVLVSIIGLGAAAYASITNTGAVATPQPDPSIWMAVFGVMLLGSVYFLAVRALGPGRDE